MINKRGQRSSTLGFALLMIAFVLVLTLFATIEPMKEYLDDARDTTSLNCKGTSTFNQTAFDEDNTFEKIVRRPTCFITGITMIWFVGSFLITLVVWIVRKWGKLSK